LMTLIHIDMDPLCFYDPECNFRLWIATMRLDVGCLDGPKGINGYYMFHKCCKYLDVWMTLKETLWTVHSLCKSWMMQFKNVNFRNVMEYGMPQWPEWNMNHLIIFIPWILQVLGCPGALKENLDNGLSVILMWIFIHDVRDDIYRVFITLNEIQFELPLGDGIQDLILCLSLQMSRWTVLNQWILPVLWIL
jgi:hypothetical protein